MTITKEESAGIYLRWRQIINIIDYRGLDFGFHYWKFEASN